jgi:chromosome segregation ATPase
MNKYTIEYRAAEADLKAMWAELSEKGGASLGPESSPKEIELKRWAVEQADLETQLLKLDTDQTQLKDKKALGQIPPPVVQSVDANTDVIHARAAVRDTKERLNAMVAGGGDKSEAAASLRSMIAISQKQMDEIQTTGTAKAMQDYEDDLTWRRQNIRQRLDAIDKTVTRLKQELAEISIMRRALAAREADAELYRKFIMRYDEQIMDIEMAAKSIGSR